MHTDAGARDVVVKLVAGGDGGLAHLSDRELLANTRSLVGKSNQLFAALLAHLAEVEARGLHRTKACSSLYDVSRSQRPLGRAGLRSRANDAGSRPAAPRIADGGTTRVTPRVGRGRVGPALRSPMPFAAKCSLGLLRLISRDK